MPRKLQNEMSRPAEAGQAEYLPILNPGKAQRTITHTTCT